EPKDFLVDLRVMDVDEAVIHGGNDHPVRGLVAIELIGADQHDGHTALGKAIADVRGTDAAHFHVDVRVLQIPLKLLVYERKYFLLVLATDAADKQRSFLTDKESDAKTAAPGRQRKPVGTAATVAGSHEDRGRLAPNA